MIALSSAYKQALVAVEINGKQAFRTLEANCKHSENLLPSLDEALEEIGEKIQSNDFYGVVIGPGSFTGLRIASALIKGLLAGNSQKNVIALTTFELMAYSYIKNFSPKDNFVCIINGLSGYYFICEFDSSGKQVGTERMATKEEVEKIQVTKVSLKEEHLEGDAVEPSSQELLQLCKEKIDSKTLINASEITPLYLRKSQAEASLEEKEKNSKI